MDSVLTAVGITLLGIAACFPIVTHWVYLYRNRNNPFLKYRMRPVPGTPEEEKMYQEFEEWVATHDVNGRLRR
jgi:hypothetical protein